MQPYTYKNIHSLANQFDYVLNFQSWKESGVTLQYLENLIDLFNLRTILSQTENAETAPALQKKMLALSTRINTEGNEYQTPQFNELAFRIMGIAKGIFNVGTKPDWNSLPMELIKEIFSHVVKKKQQQHGKIFQCDIEPLVLISKKWNMAALEVHKDWMEKILEDWSTDVYRCYTLDSLLKCIKDKKMKRIVTCYQFEDADLKNLLESCEHLSHITIYARNIKDISLDAPYPSLQSLFFSDCQISITQKLPTILSNFPELKVLKFGNPFHFEGVQLSQAFSSIPKLEQLYLSNWVEEKMLADALLQLPNLSTLDLTHFHFVYKGDELAKVLPQLTSLRTLNMCQTGITPWYLEEIISKLPQLTHLSLTTVPFATFRENLGSDDDDSLLARALLNLSSLQSLCLPHLHGLKGEKLAPILTNNSSLRSLYLPHCRELTVLPKLPNLTTLDIAHCYKLTGEKLLESLSGCPRLTELDITGCRFTYEELEEALLLLPDLKNLVMEKLRITDEQAKRLRANFPHIRFTGMLPFFYSS